MMLPARNDNHLNVTGGKLITNILLIATNTEQHFWNVCLQKWTASHRGTLQIRTNPIRLIDAEEQQTNECQIKNSRMIVECVKEIYKSGKRTDINFIFRKHSEFLINRHHLLSIYLSLIEVVDGEKVKNVRW